MKQGYNLSLISKNRDTVYALSILWIMLFHMTIRFRSPSLEIIQTLKDYGNTGVEIFLFVSGISLFFSFSKNPSIRQFYAKRIKRVLVPYLILAIVWLSYIDIYHDHDIKSFIFDLLRINLFVTGRRTFWFITVILICYLIYPFVHRIYEKMNYSVLSLALVLGAMLLINLALSKLWSKWSLSEILWTRIPIFLLGSWLGKYVKEKKSIKIPTPVVVVAAIGILIVYIIYYDEICYMQMYRYMLAILGVAMTFLFSIVGELKAVNKLSGFFAPITLEIYLIHEVVMKIVTMHPLISNKLLLNIVAAVVSIAIAWVFNKLVGLLLSLTDKKKKIKAA